MDDCSAYLNLISARLDGELSVKDEELLQAHLDHCPACRALLADLTAVHLETAQPSGDVPLGFSQRVIQAVQAEAAADIVHRKRRHRWQAAAGMAAVLALVVWATGPLDDLFSAKNGDSAAPEAASTRSAENPSTPNAASGGAVPFTADGPAAGGGSRKEITSAPPEELSLSPDPEVSNAPVSQGGASLDGQTEGETTQPSDYPSLPEAIPEEGTQPATQPSLPPVSYPNDSFTITGSIPALLSDYPSYAWEDGSHTIQVPTADFQQIAQALTDLGMIGERGDPNSDVVWIHVIPFQAG